MGNGTNGLEPGAEKRRPRTSLSAARARGEDPKSERNKSQRRSRKDDRNPDPSHKSGRVGHPRQNAGKGSATRPLPTDIHAIGKKARLIHKCSVRPIVVEHRFDRAVTLARHRKLLASHVVNDKTEDYHCNGAAVEYVDSRPASEVCSLDSNAFIRVNCLPCLCSPDIPCDRVSHVP